MSVSLECCVCGNGAGRFKQHWNRDDGYGICPDCVRWLRERGTSEAEILDLYGNEGVNFAVVEPVDLPGHEKPQHWFDSNTNGFKTGEI